MSLYLNNYDELTTINVLNLVFNIMFSRILDKVVHIIKPVEKAMPEPTPTQSEIQMKDTVFDCLKTIKDPEKPATLEALEVIREDGISVQQPFRDSGVYLVRVEFHPTVPHCNLATLIGLCIRVKLLRTLSERIKLDIVVREGSHDIEDEVNKQINDKERVAAALENPSLRELVEKCILEQE